MSICLPHGARQAGSVIVMSDHDDYLAANRRRREAARRMPPIECTKCGRWVADPDVHGCEGVDWLTVDRHQ